MASHGNATPSVRLQHRVVGRKRDVVSTLRRPKERERETNELKRVRAFLFCCGECAQGVPHICLQILHVAHVLPRVGTRAVGPAGPPFAASALRRSHPAHNTFLKQKSLHVFLDPCCIGRRSRRCRRFLLPRRMETLPSFSTHHEPGRLARAYQRAAVAHQMPRSEDAVGECDSSNATLCDSFCKVLMEACDGNPSWLAGA